MKKLLLILPILIVSSYGVSAKNYKGRCGANLKWQYLSDSRTLYITGTGMMDDYGVFDKKNKETPWERFHELQTVIIEEGVMSVGTYAFEKCMNLERVSFPRNTPFHIYKNAFRSCPRLDSITITPGFIDIGNQAFMDCSSLKTLSIENGIKTIGEAVFAKTLIKDVYLPASVTSAYGTFQYCDSLEWIYVAPDNPVYTSLRGWLCSKDTSVLHAVPCNENGRVKRYNAQLEHTLDSLYDLAKIKAATAPSATFDSALHVLDSTIAIVKYVNKMRLEQKLLLVTPPIRKVNSYAITGLIDTKFLVFGESVEFLYAASILGCKSLISVAFPSSLKSFGFNKRICMVNCNGLRQVLIASEKPELLLRFLVDDNPNGTEAINSFRSIFILDTTFGSSCEWYVPVTVYEGYKKHPYWGTLNLKPTSNFEHAHLIYWINDNGFYSLMNL